MPAAYVSNLVIDAGSNFNQTFTLASAADGGSFGLDEYDLTAHMRKHAVSSKKTVFTVTKIAETSGVFVLSLTSDQTVNLKPGRYVYDVLATLSDTSEKIRVLEGTVLVREGVTR